MSALLRAVAHSPPAALDKGESPEEGLKGRSLGHFRVIECLGKGGMGVVYRAHDEKTGREVALKVLPTALLDQPNRRERMRREARVLALVRHSNVAALWEAAPDHDPPFFAMELIRGTTLRVRMRSALLVREAIDLALKIAEGLAALHAQGIIHRDLKPENVMITADEDVKILDLGLARFEDNLETIELASTVLPESFVTATRQVVGTRGYMSPEQALGYVVGAPSDIFSFGACFFEMLTGRTAASCATLRRELDDQEIPPAVANLVLKCLKKEPQERYADAGELVSELKRAMKARSCGSLARRVTLLIAVAVACAVAGGRLARSTSAHTIAPQAPAAPRIAQAPSADATLVPPASTAALVRAERAPARSQEGPASPVRRGSQRSAPRATLPPPPVASDPTLQVDPDEREDAYPNLIPPSVGGSSSP